MKNLPAFSSRDRKRLEALGLVDMQIQELRFALIHIRKHIAKPATRNGVAQILDDVDRLADELLQKTQAVVLQISPEHAQAHMLIEDGFWKAMPRARGPSSFQNIAPNVLALRNAAREGRRRLSIAPSRRKSASPQPVAAIRDALLRGWAKKYGSNHARVVGKDREGQRVIAHPTGPQSKPYPPKFKPSGADGSAFRKVVGICYESVGGNADPVAAIRNFLKAERKLGAEAMKAFEMGVESVSRKPNRTSRKE